VDIDSSSLVKRSRSQESEQLLEFLKVIDPNITPEWFIEISKKIANVRGLSLPTIESDKVKQMQPQGGISQFTSKNVPPTAQ